MAIGIDASRAFQAAPTGIGVYATQVCRGLIANPPSELRLYRNARRAPLTAPPLPAGSEWRLIPLPRGWTLVRLALEVRRHPPELLFVPAYRLPPGRLPRSVVTVHGVEHRLAAQAYPGGSGQAVESFVQDALARAARLIVPSETTRADLVQMYSADPATITVIPHGVGAELEPRSADQVAVATARLGIPGPYFLAVGAHHRRKNIPFLIRAFASAFPAGRERPWLVVANATGRTAIELTRVAQVAGCSDHLRLLPHVSGEALGALYSGALAACVPSLYEGFGLPALEAMACGAPVLAGDVGGVAEVAAGAALLVELGSQPEWEAALIRLAREPGLRSHLRQLGLARAGRYSWKRSIEDHSLVLADELARARRDQFR
ncbi:MAG TPA: glycosyltransferase family 1 protein [Candidatus Nanopelagicaceae bacterium]|nr:glycosyltransferase family 1 protein [Candidatus Nanopelagicaceae bacterium]